MLDNCFCEICYGYKRLNLLTLFNNDSYFYNSNDFVNTIVLNQQGVKTRFFFSNIKLKKKKPKQNQHKKNQKWKKLNKIYKKPPRKNEKINKNRNKQTNSNNNDITNREKINLQKQGSKTLKQQKRFLNIYLKTRNGIRANRKHVCK